MIVPCGASVWPRAVQEDVDHLRGVLNWSIGLYWAGVLPPAAGPELPFQFATHHSSCQRLETSARAARRRARGDPCRGEAAALSCRVTNRGRSRGKRASSPALPVAARRSRRASVSTGAARAKRTRRSGIASDCGRRWTCRQRTAAGSGDGLTALGSAQSASRTCAGRTQPAPPAALDSCTCAPRPPLRCGREAALVTWCATTCGTPLCLYPSKRRACVISHTHGRTDAASVIEVVASIPQVGQSSWRTLLLGRGPVNATYPHDDRGAGPGSPGGDCHTHTV